MMLFDEVGIVVGVVEMYCRGMLVIGCPAVSVTVATSVVVTFCEALTGPEGGVVEPAVDRTIEAGGHGLKKPAVLEACELTALMVVEPG